MLFLERNKIIFIILYQMNKRVPLEGLELDEHYREMYEIEKEKQDRIKKSKELELVCIYFIFYYLFTPTPIIQINLK